MTTTTVHHARSLDGIKRVSRTEPFASTLQPTNQLEQQPSATRREHQEMNIPGAAWLDRLFEPENNLPAWDIAPSGSMALHSPRTPEPTIHNILHPLIQDNDTLACPPISDKTSHLPFLAAPGGDTWDTSMFFPDPVSQGLGRTSGISDIPSATSKSSHGDFSALEQATPRFAEFDDLPIGTDWRFSKNGYLPPSPDMTEAKLTEHFLRIFESIRPIDALEHSDSWVDLGAEAGIRAAKRRRIDTNEDNRGHIDDQQQPPPEKSYPTSISKTENQPSAQPIGPTTITEHRFRRGVGKICLKRYTRRTDPRIPRGRLTELQKKRNHSLSEKARQQNLRRMLDEICAMIPGLDPMVATKCFILKETADWIQDISSGNEKLKEQLKNLPPLHPS
ncbi:hypothetical protein FQN55_004436 [Onygenales sp. PD_40]|nr:hypothetical protein FQN55_004436 [Onygenales sp. PD_40]KAK2782739.1 hypothetical protein FQN53_009600 [Emmonsiellopsis sp. PD_33]